ncbi:zinc finger and SCAN domain-containing protein 31-like [Suricata suricatta]|uniref:zinc finger and SCAN domain-containing protein 31-like n=1 Tax=Suricata suricatta TaxID=37032 RepID=UPI0011556EE6|nr:zinc finger and SCAN domain-containing protein 31-like [Suricata suricatta]
MGSPGACSGEGGAGGGQPWSQGLSFWDNQPPAWEIFRQRFRRFCYQETPGPRGALRRLRELCGQWLRPETRRKEQILELLVLQQFLTIPPAELQARAREQHPESGEQHPESGEQAVAALEDLDRKRRHV